jgi:hypothetical protein
LLRCAGAWHAEHGRKRKTGRVVIRAIKAFMDGGGSWDDVEKLKVSAMVSDDLMFGLDIDPLGYMAETAKSANETILPTSEMLADALRLVHPDAHPEEGRDLANRVTQQLLALQPFVFPAAKPKPAASREAARNAPVEVAALDLKEPSRPRYPCADCASTIPWNYCTACRAQWERRKEQEREQRRPQQRKWYAQRKARLARFKQPTPCAACGMAYKGKRKDARFCSAACRQRAHRRSVTDKQTSLVASANGRDMSAPT